MVKSNIEGGGGGEGDPRGHVPPVSIYMHLKWSSQILGVGSGGGGHVLPVSIYMHLKRIYLSSLLFGGQRCKHSFVCACVRLPTRVTKLSVLLSSIVP